MKRASAGIAFGMLALGVAGCASAPEMRIASKLSASDFNSLASQYMSRPTFVSLLDGDKGSPVLLVRMSPYNGYVKETGATKEYWSAAFEKKFAGDYLPLIDKYFEWEKLALERGDAFEREIGQARTSTGFGSGTGSLKFTFYSGTATSHDLIVTYCITVCEEPLHFSHDNAAELRRLIIELQDGKLTAIDVGSIYK